MKRKGMTEAELAVILRMIAVGYRIKPNRYRNAVLTRAAESVERRLFKRGIFRAKKRSSK